ncbi:MAG: glycosyltransferase [Thiohalocapsa sp.]
MSFRAGEIWLLWDDTAPFGMDAHVISLAHALRVHGVYVRVVCLGSMTQHLRHLGRRQGMVLTSIPARAAALLDAASVAKPRLMHTHGARTGILARLVGLRLHVPVVSTLQPERDANWRSALYAIADRLTRRLSKGLIALREPVDGPSPARAQQMRPFVQLGERPARLPTVVAQIMTARSARRPQPFHHLLAMVPPIDFVVYRIASRESLYSVDCPGVRLIDIRAGALVPWGEIGLLCLMAGDAPDYANALQAMANGVPVVACAAGALGQSVIDGENGWLVRPGNLATMAHRISTWDAMDDAERRALSDRARRSIAERYSAQSALPDLLDAYTRAGA